MADVEDHATFGAWRWVALALLVASWFTALAPTIITPAIPALERYFAETPNSALLARLSLTLPSLLTGLCAPFAGWLADRLGRKRLLVGASALYALAGASGAVLDDLYAILAGRALLGVAVAGTMTAATTLIGDYFTGTLRQRLYGYQVAFMTLGASIFILLGGGLADLLGWRGPFLVYLVALAALPFFINVIQEPHSGAAQVNSEAGDAGAELTNAHRVGVGGLIGLIGLWFIVLYLIPVQAPYLIEALGYKPEWPSAATLAIYTSAAAVTSIGFSRLETRLGPRRLFALAFGAAALGFFTMASATSLWPLFAGCVLIGLGLGAIMPNAMNWLARLGPSRLRGRIMGGATMAVFFGQFLSPFATQPIAAVWNLATAFGGAGALCASLAGGFALWSLGHHLRPKRADT